MADQVFGGAFLSVVFDRIASKEVLDLFRGEKVINKRLAKLKSALKWGYTSRGCTWDKI